MLRFAVLAVTASFAASAAPAWDVGGTWRGAPGTLTLVQSGSTVRLTLRLVSSPAGPARCASSQTLRGTVSRAGTAMALVLANAHQVSPPTPFRGRAKKLPGG